MSAELIRLLKTGDLDALKELEKQGVDITADCDGVAPIVIAAGAGNVAVVEYLFKIGNFDAAMKSLSLYRAAMYGNREVVELLVKEYGISDPDAVIKASENGHKNIVEFLIDSSPEGASIFDSEKGATVLVNAISGDHEDLFFSLLEKYHPSITVEADGGVTPWKAAVNGNNENIMKVLIEHKADVDQITNSFWKSNAVHDCLLAKQFTTVKFLLKSGARVDAEDVDGRPPLDVLVRMSSGMTKKIFLDMAQSLLTHGAHYKGAEHYLMVGKKLKAEYLEALESLAQEHKRSKLLDHSDDDESGSDRDNSSGDVMDVSSASSGSSHYNVVEGDIQHRLFTGFVENLLMRYLYLVSRNVDESAKLPVPLGYVDVPGDGLCFYHAIASQLGGKYNARELQQMAIDEVVNHLDRYEAFVAQAGGISAFLNYHLQRQESEKGGWADNIMIQALANALGHRIDVQVFDRAGNAYGDALQIGNPNAPVILRLGNIANLHFVAANNIQGPIQANNAASSSLSSSSSSSVDNHLDQLNYEGMYKNDVVEYEYDFNKELKTKYGLTDAVNDFIESLEREARGVLVNLEAGDFIYYLQAYLVADRDVAAVVTLMEYNKDKEMCTELVKQQAELLLQKIYGKEYAKSNDADDGYMQTKPVENKHYESVAKIAEASDGFVYGISNSGIDGDNVGGNGSAPTPSPTVISASNPTPNATVQQVYYETLEFGDASPFEFGAVLMLSGMDSAQ